MEMFVNISMSSPDTCTWGCFKRVHGELKGGILVIRGNNSSNMH